MAAVVFEDLEGKKSEATPGQRAFRRLLRRRGAMVGLAFVIFFILLALLAPWIAPYAPLATSWGAIRNALIPVITLGAIEFGRLLSGAVLTEQIFAIPGFGKLLVDGVFNRDYAVVQGVVLVSATLYVLLNLLADILYFVANPRLRGT